MILAVDFDGTLCKDEYPDIGEPNYNVIDFIKRFKDIDENKLILWTCRCDEKLVEAINWCNGFEIYFDAVNDNVEEVKSSWDTEGRKIYADYYLDDKAINVIDIYAKNL